MPELRKDPIISRWVIIAIERAKRPYDFEILNEPKNMTTCLFCAGNENKTPKEVLVYRKKDFSWSVRVVPNKYPALTVEGELEPKGEGVYDKMNGIGAHEVIIETPNHLETLATMEISNIKDILLAYKERIIDLKNDIRFKYILIFKNEGKAAGASLEHSHSQLIALPIIPRTVQSELNGALDYYNYKGRCVYCDIIYQERDEKKRLIYENDDFIVISPYAPRFPFETWILPKEHSAFFEDCKEGELNNLAISLSHTLKKLDKALNKPPYNFIIHNSPIKQTYTHYYHWHIEIMPRLTKIAGFEWGSGFYINPTPPEESAKFLRELDI